MSKSSGEFLTVSLLEKKGYDPLVYRLFCLQSHYRKSLVFSYEALDSAKSAYDKLVARIASLKDGDGEVDAEKFAVLKKNFTDALDNDLNTALALTAVYDVLKSDANNATKLALIKDFDRVLSLSLEERANKAANDSSSAAEGIDPELSAKIEDLVARRSAAKKEKNFALADEIRAELTSMGVSIVDTKEGTKWSL